MTCSSLQHTGAKCSTLHIATTLQHTAAYTPTKGGIGNNGKTAKAYDSQHATTNCSTLKQTTTHCNTLPAHCSVHTN